MRKSHPLFRISSYDAWQQRISIIPWEELLTNLARSDKVFAALETFRVELPSWGFATPALVSESSCKLRRRLRRKSSAMLAKSTS